MCDDAFSCILQEALCRHGVTWLQNFVTHPACIQDQQAHAVTYHKGPIIPDPCSYALAALI